MRALKRILRHPGLLAAEDGDGPPPRNVYDAATLEAVRAYQVGALRTGAAGAAGAARRAVLCPSC